MNGKTIVIDACLGGTDSGEEITLTKDSDETFDSSERVLNAYDNFKDVLAISNHINWWSYLALSGNNL